MLLQICGSKRGRAVSVSLSTLAVAGTRVARLRSQVRSLLALCGGLAGSMLSAADVTVHDAASLRTAIAAATPGTRVVLRGGDYGGGFHFKDLRGEPGLPIVLMAADPQQPPVFSGANTGLHFSNPAHLELRGLVITKLAHNGINIDDGGGALATGARDSEPSTRHIVLRGLRVSDIGAEGNHDGIKLSGLYDFQVIDCTIERWGTKGGSAIDLVGCHRGLIEKNVIRHIEPAPPNCTAVQCKGGTSAVTVRGNRFEHAGGRGVNIGGGTGLQFFRPRLQEGREHAEAREITVEGNTFVGGITAVAFAGADGAVVRFNTIERPGRWALRILQENKAPGFVACRNGVFTDNLIVFESTKWSEGGVNIGGGTAPETFTFARNWWYCADRPERSAPKLPTPETGGVYGRESAAAKGQAGADAWRGR